VRHGGAAAIPSYLRHGLESVKKTDQVVDVGTGFGAPGPSSGTSDPDRSHEMSVTMAQGMRRLGTPIAALLGLALAALVASSWLVNRDALRSAIEAQIRAVTGLDLVVNGSIDVSLFPGSYVSFHDVGLKGGGTADPALRVDVLTANLRLLPLLLQRFEIADVMMLRPQIHIVRDSDGTSNWTPFIQTITRTMRPGAENQMSFSEIRIQDGIVALDDGAQGTEKLDDVDLSLAWPSISRSFAATGQFDWRGQRIEGSISISDFLAALSGDRSGLKMRLASPPLKLAFDGTVANRTSALLEGTLSIDSPSLREALRWTGQTPLGAGGFGRFALRARANVVGGAIALTNVNVELDGNTAEGVMTYTNNGRQTLQATLAADALDFTPYISTFRLLANGARDWNRQMFDLKALSTTDLDMRLSAARVTVGSSKLGRTAFGANLRNGVLALSVGEAQMYGGVVRGSFGIARADTMADIKAELQFTDVDLQACAGELFGVSSLSGRGNLNVSLTASGSSPFGLAQSLDGNATLTGHDGAISGFNVEQLLKRLERRPLSGSGNFRSGSTPYNDLTVAVKFSDGVATADDIRVEGPTARITMTGTASVPTREYDFKGVASLQSAANGGNSFDLPFVVQGPWDDPLIFPDPESLIRRAPAAAPLLDAVKDKLGAVKDKNVRSMLERFTGGLNPAPAPQESPTPTPSDTPSADDPDKPN
jgi:AsmA protein